MTGKDGQDKTVGKSVEDNIFDQVHEVDLKKTMEESYIDYAMSVISQRALPDVRDGLKPVQRRVLYRAEQRAGQAAPEMCAYCR